MKIAEYIKDQVLEPRLRQKQALVVYDAAGRYHYIAFSMAGSDFRVIDASTSIVEAREAAMEALVERGTQSDKKPYVLIYVPTAPPADEDARCADFFSAIAEAGDWFPKGDGDSYLNLCLQAKPDFGNWHRRKSPKEEIENEISRRQGRYSNLGSDDHA
jgi:hypothetical protein